MQIGAVQKLTLLDFPDKTAAVLFTLNCSMRCGYCHNPDFVVPEKIEEVKQCLIPFDVFINFLETRKELIDGVVISGGEPTLQPDLAERIKEIREMGFLVKLDTNGLHPEVLEKLLDRKLLDYVAMDLKHVPERYDELCDMPVEKVRQALEKSIDLIRTAGIDYEFRSTVLPDLHDIDSLLDMGEMIRGCRKWAIQNFRPQMVLDMEYKAFRGFAEVELAALERQLGEFAQTLEIRN